MSVCTFFGHRDCFSLDPELLRNTLAELIAQGVDTFYVGNHGNFDGMVYTCLKRLSKTYPHICYAVVLAYLPEKRREFEDLSDTIYPEGLEIGLPKFAIERRNKWMLEQAEWCVCYVNYAWGGAYKFARRAKRRGLRVVNLGSAQL